MWDWNTVRWGRFQALSEIATGGRGFVTPLYHLDDLLDRAREYIEDLQSDDALPEILEDRRR